MKIIAHRGASAVRPENTLAAFEAALPDPAVTDIASIGLSCALGYLDWRKPVDWREHYPRLAHWLAAFAAREPAFARLHAEAV